jgi:hypothetical protein
MTGRRDRRHVLNLVQKSTSQDTRGQPTGSDTVIVANVFCSIDSITGRQSEIAHQLYPSATKTIRCTLDSGTTVNTNMAWVEVATGKRFEIGYVHDELRYGMEIETLCSEVLR